MVLPKPPIKTITDFVVFCFVTVVIIGLLISFITIASISIFTDRDVSQAFAAMSDIMTTLIGALVGFIAGKGSHEDQSPGNES